MLVEEVVINWYLLMEYILGGKDGCGREGRHHGYFFYMHDSLVASTDPEYMQGALNTITRLFNRVGLRTNAGKAVRMLCLP